MPDIFLADGAAASSVDRCHSLRSLLPPPAALPSLPTGYNTNTLSGFTATAARSGNLYRCIITDGSGNTITSNEVKLNTTDFTIYRQPSNAWGILGDTVSFSVRTYSTTSITYQWQYSYDGGVNWHNSSASVNTTNTLTGLTVTDARLGYRYRCVVTNENGVSITSNEVRMRLKTDTWQHTYDANGMRTQRTDGYTTYKYIYNGSSLRRMTVGDQVLTFGYDACGKPMYVQWSGARYFYLTNIQGDVVGLLDSSGNVVVTYAYDAWGNILKVDGDQADDLGKLNPLRYRGYVYDVETGLYYLQSRYYNPEMGRFINADDIAYLGAGGFASYNLFAHCENNPVMGYDPTGFVNWGGVALGVGIAVLAVAAIALTVATAGAASPLIATAGSAVGTTISAALVESSIITTTGAIAEVPVVYDTTIVAGNDRFGGSVVIDYGNNTTDVYLHQGVQSHNEISVTFGTGFVFNHTERGSYAGEFIDTSYSKNYKGANLGIDCCTSPDNISGNGFMQQGTSAIMLTSGIGSSIFRYKTPSVAYDYYWYVAAL